MIIMTTTTFSPVQIQASRIRVAFVPSSNRSDLSLPRKLDGGPGGVLIAAQRARTSCCCCAVKPERRRVLAFLNALGEPESVQANHADRKTRQAAVSLNCAFLETGARGSLAASSAQLGLLVDGRGDFRILGPPLFGFMLVVVIDKEERVSLWMESDCDNDGKVNVGRALHGRCFKYPSRLTTPLLSKRRQGRVFHF